MKREREKSKYEKSIVPYNMLTMFPNGLRLMGNNGCLEYLAQGPSKICKKTFQKLKTVRYFYLGITGLNENPFKSAKILCSWSQIPLKYILNQYVSTM